MKFKVGDLVMVTLDNSPNKGKISKITRVHNNDSSCPAVYVLKDFSSTYSETSLAKVEYKPGDQVEILTPCEHQGHIETVESVEAHGDEIFYEVSNIHSIRFAEKNLKLVEIPMFEIGDSVYVDDKLAKIKDNCYQIFTVSAPYGDYGLLCYDKDYNDLVLDKRCLKKTALKEGDTVEIRQQLWVVKKVYISMLHYICYTLESLVTKETASFTEEDLKNKINNYKLSKNENRLQRKETCEQRGHDARGSRVYGRKPKSTIKIQCLSYQKVSCRS